MVAVASAVVVLVGAYLPFWVLTDLHEVPLTALAARGPETVNPNGIRPIWELLRLLVFVCGFAFVLPMYFLGALSCVCSLLLARRRRWTSAVRALVGPVVLLAYVVVIGLGPVARATSWVLD